VVDFLNKNGINFILKIIKTKNGDLVCDFENSVFGLFEYIEGEHSEDYPLSMLFEKYSKIYQIDTRNLDIKKENFRASSIGLYESNLEKIRSKNNKGVFNEIIQYFDSKEELIEKYKEQLVNLGKLCSRALILPYENMAKFLKN
jgi:hypothetical protein